MKLLNLGCGGKRPQDLVWRNMDSLQGQMPEDQWLTIEKEPNYIEADISKRLPFHDDQFDGCLLAHVLEHFSVQLAQSLLKECLRVLKPGGVIMASVPDAEYFRHVHPQDHGASTWPDLYGVFDPPNPIPTWMQAALYFEQHFQVFSEDTLWCALTQAGFVDVNRGPKPPVYAIEPFTTLSSLLDRIPFSLVMTGVK